MVMVMVMVMVMMVGGDGGGDDGDAGGIALGNCGNRYAISSKLRMNVDA